MTYQDTGMLHLAALKLTERVQRGAKRFLRPRWLRYLQQRNLTSTASVVADRGPVVSLTTYGARLQQVFYTLESIANGAVLPSRLTLWLDEKLVAHGLPESLQRLMRRGLEVHGVTDMGPHTKYYPAVMALSAPEHALITADDDILYPRYWLRDLVTAACNNPEWIHCYRAHVMQLHDAGGFIPYASWQRCASQRPSHWHFATGVCGVSYPPHMQRALREQGEAFISVCPKADDIWLNAIALRTHTPVRQIVPWPARFYELPDTRDGGLARANNGEGGNDRQLAATYTAADLHYLRQRPQYFAG